MYKITVLGTSTVEGFEPSPINGKISGANLTLTITITDDDNTILHPGSPVRICAWLQTTPQDRPRFLSPTSGRKDDLLWTETAAERGSLTIVFRIGRGSLNEASLAAPFLEVAQLRIRVDLPEYSSAAISPGLVLAGPVADEYSTEPSPSYERSETSTLQTLLLNAASPQTPLDVITIGSGLFDVALHHANLRLRKLWRDFIAQDALPAGLEPSIVAIADDARRMIMEQGKDTTTEAWVERAIKSRYNVPMLQLELPKALAFVVSLKFLHLDSSGLGDGACNRAWSLIVAADDPTLDESARESKASQIEVLALSSIWHSTEKASPKLLLILRGSIPAEQLTLLDMLQSDGWDVVEQLNRLPGDLFAQAPADMDVTFFVLEYRTGRRDYVEVVVSNFERSYPGKTDESKIDPELRRVAGSTADGNTTVPEKRQDHDCGAQAKDKEHPALELTAPLLQAEQSPKVLNSATTAAKGTQGQGQGQSDAREAPDFQPQTNAAAKHHILPEELSSSEKKRRHRDSSPGEKDRSMVEAGHDAAAAHGTTNGLLHSALNGGTTEGVADSEAEVMTADDTVDIHALQEDDEKHRNVIADCATK